MNNKYTQIKDLVIEEFKSYYYDHSAEDTMKHFNLSRDTFYNFVSKNNFPHKRQGKIQQLADKLDKDEVLEFYKTHTLEDTANYFGTTNYILGNIFELWGVTKHPISQNIELGCMKKYGVKSYSSTDEFKNKLSNTFANKSEEEKAERANKISKSFAEMPDDKRAERLRKINTSPNLKARNSKPNAKFKQELQANGISAIETEFVLGKYVYDFKVDNTLIEINPFASHNSSWGYRNGSPKSATYHYDKTKYAKDNGYECINIWDWSNEDSIIRLIKNGYKTNQKDIKCHLYNYITGEHKIVNQLPEILNRGEVIIYDDGQVISLED